MRIALAVLVVMGALGAIDTIYYHELILRLPDAPGARRELRLHASRDFVYAILFGSLAWTIFAGAMLWPLIVMLGLEIAITLSDFLEEDRTRRLPGGERVMHALMGIVYGVFLALLAPQIMRWSALGTGFIAVKYGAISWV